MAWISAVVRLERYPIWPVLALMAESILANVAPPLRLVASTSWHEPHQLAYSIAPSRGAGVGDGEGVDIVARASAMAWISAVVRVERYPMLPALPLMAESILVNVAPLFLLAASGS
jgi:hypothetical protein